MQGNLSGSTEESPEKRSAVMGQIRGRDSGCGIREGRKKQKFGKQKAEISEDWDGKIAEMQKMKGHAFMNPKLNNLFARRSVRRYADAPIDEATVHDLLEAAMAAPSAVARDPWHFIVVRDRERLGRMADALPNGQMLRTAPLGLLVCGDIEVAHDGQLSYLLQDCSAAIENLLLAASMLELGACWLGVHPRPERIEALREVFSLPANIIPVSAIAIGVPAETPPPRTRYRDDAVHHDAW